MIINVIFFKKKSSFEKYWLFNLSSKNIFHTAKFNIDIHTSNIIIWIICSHTTLVHVHRQRKSRLRWKQIRAPAATVSYCWKWISNHMYVAIFARSVLRLRSSLMKKRQIHVHEVVEKHEKLYYKEDSNYRYVNMYVCRTDMWPKCFEFWRSQNGYLSNKLIKPTETLIKRRWKLFSVIRYSTYVNNMVVSET